MDASISSILSAIDRLSSTGDADQETLNLLVKRLQHLYQESEPTMSEADRIRFEQLFAEWEKHTKS